MRRALLTTIVALVVSAGLFPTTAAAAPRVRNYEGPTSEGGRVHIQVLVSNGVPYLGLVLVEGPYLCEDGTEGEVETGVGWFPRGPAIEDENFDLSENWDVIAFTVSGRLGSQRGSGTLTFLMPGLTADQQAAQVCALGEVTWSVERTTEEASAVARDGLVKRVGERTITMKPGASERTVGFARTGALPVRQYRGRTSQDLPMAARTQRADSGIALLGLSWGSVMVCEDGSEQEWYFRRPQSPTVLPPGRLDFDEEPTLESPWALHIHGELDAHLGSGTTAQVLPVITDDLQAQLCESGDQTWELWRTDAGY